MKKKVLSVLSVVVIIATVGLNTLVVSNGSSKNILKMDLISKVLADSNGSSSSSTSSNKYQDLDDYCNSHFVGDPQPCTLYSKVNLSTKVVVSTSATSIDAEDGYEITTRQGLIESCPKSGMGCSIYSCI